MFKRRFRRIVLPIRNTQTIFSYRLGIKSSTTLHKCIAVESIRIITLTTNPLSFSKAILLSLAILQICSLSRSSNFAQTRAISYLIRQSPKHLINNMLVVVVVAVVTSLMQGEGSHTLEGFPKMEEIIGNSNTLTCNSKT